MCIFLWMMYNVTNMCVIFWHLHTLRVIIVAVVVRAMSYYSSYDTKKGRAQKMKLSYAATKTRTELEFHLFIFARCLRVCFGFYTLMLLLLPLLVLLMMISFFLRSFGSLCMFYVLQITSVRVSYYIFPIFHLHSYYITNFTHFSSKFISNYDDHCTHHIYLCIRLLFFSKNSISTCFVVRRLADYIRSTDNDRKRDEDGNEDKEREGER